MNPMQGMPAAAPSQATNTAPGMDGQLQQAYQQGAAQPSFPLDAPRPSAGMFSPGPSDEPPAAPEPAAPPIRQFLESVNIAENLDDDKLAEIGEEAHKGFEQDLQSRRDWDRNIDEWMKLATQVREEKTYPWPRASNIKYPLLSTAAMQFSARAYPSLVPSNGQIVKSQVIGKDPTGDKQKKAERTSIYVSYQLLHEMDDWEEEMDKLLITLPVVGTMFKKTYFDTIKQRNVSKLVQPKNVVVNYWTKSLNDCERISEILELSPRVLKERQNAKVFLDIDLGAPPMPENALNAPANDRTTPYTIIEQHTFLDLDDDGYEEPYVVTFHRETKQVLRIAARFDDKGLTTDEEGNVISIEPIQYYTKFGFIPNPDGSFYDIGFGVLLGPLNESVNTVINQLVDSGTLANLQAGFIGKGLRLKMGETRLQPGEWRAVNATADDLRKQVLPLPAKEPSTVLFQLMGALITSGKELASVAEIFVGKMPGQNTPATTTMATIEQGMKVFTAVYKRIYRSLTEEFKKLYRLNEVYLNPQTYVEVMDTTVEPTDFASDGYDICPGADPTAVSQTEKLLKAQGLMEMLPLGILDPLKVGIRVLEAQEQPNWQELLHPAVAQTGQPPQKPDPKEIELQMKSQAEERKAELKQQELAFKSAMQQRDQQFKQAMAAMAQQQELKYREMELRLEAAANQHKARAQMAQAQQSLVQNEMSHRQQLAHNDAKAQQQREIASSQPKPSSSSGSKTTSPKK